jgi:internalin A
MAELRDWVVLKPDWLLQQVSHLLTDKDVASHGGVVTTAEQQRIWKDCPNLVQDFLFRMMDHFDLAYRTESQPVRSIVVELSPEDRPADVNPAWEKAAAGANEVSLEYRFETTIPPGLPTWFIARSHRFTTPKLHWRRGALMIDDLGRHSALLQADLDGRRVALSARGPVPQNFFALLKDCFEGTLRRFPGLLPRVDRVIPCPKPGCKGDFKLSDLEAYLAEGDDSVRCHGCRTKHSIASLLFGNHPAGSALAMDLLHEIKDENRARHQELLSFLQREFTELFHREQSLGESHCPSVFTLEFERLPKILPTQLEAWWRALTDKPEPVVFTLYCEQPGAWHSVKSYRIEQPGRRLTALAPHLEKLVALFKVAGPLIGLTPAKVAIDTMRGLAELGAN